MIWIANWLAATLASPFLQKSETGMEIQDIEQALLKSHKLRITTAMGQYILKNLESSETPELPIIAGDARTGVPVRAMIALDALRQTPQPQ
jgi:hypothetical protein